MNRRRGALQEGAWIVCSGEKRNISGFINVPIPESEDLFPIPSVSRRTGYPYIRSLLGEKKGLVVQEEDYSPPPFPCERGCIRLLKTRMPTTMIIIPIPATARNNQLKSCSIGIEISEVPSLALIIRSMATA